MRITIKQVSTGSMLFALIFSLSTIATAQSLRVCEQQAADADGDGFGWEFDFENGRWDSCVITSESAPPPSHVNRETGEPVTLVRAFWNANADIANRDIRCETYWFEDASGVYEEFPDRNYAINSPILGSYNLLHQPLFAERPYLNTATGYYDFSTGEPRRYVPLWGVENGIYKGVAPMAQSPYVEIVGVNGGDNNAVRVWSESTIYNLCYDTSGEAFVPTGNPGVASSSQVAAPEERVVKMPVLEDLDPPPVDSPPFTNLETGQEVVLTEPYWNYNADLALRRILCRGYVWDESNSRYEHDPLNDFSKYDYVFHPRIGDSVRVTSVYTDVSVSTWDEVLTIDSNGKLPFREGLGLVEIVDQAVRIWSSNTGYRQCTSVKLLGAADVNTYLWEFPNAYQPNFTESQGYPNDDRVGFAPTGTAPDINGIGNCDYSDAVSNGGWGWNPETRESCPPLKTELEDPVADCDYSDAPENGGWGWNPIAGESCPPVDSATTPEPDVSGSCDYTDATVNGGWGWNPETRESCPAVGDNTPATNNCDYANADVNGGWGWDGVAGQSCPPIE